MTPDATTPQAEPLRFDTAPAAGGTMTCAECSGTIRDQYYEAGGRVLCTRCKDARAATSGSFALALTFGLGATIVGAVAYYAITAALDGTEIGLIAGLLGIGIGYAVHRGAGKRGGPRYQWMAVLLTYLSIGLAYTPFALGDSKTEARDLKLRRTATADSLRTATVVGDSARMRALAARADSLSADSGRVSGATRDAKADAGHRDASKHGLAFAFGALILLVLAMPVLSVIGSMPGGLISAVIIGYGMQRAWRMNAATGGATPAVTGPYRVGTR